MLGSSCFYYSNVVLAIRLANLSKRFKVQGITIVYMQGTKDSQM